MDLEPVKHLNIRCTVVAYRLAYDILVIVPLRGVDSGTFIFNHVHICYKVKHQPGVFPSTNGSYAYSKASP